jgi:hypothetical protein
MCTVLHSPVTSSLLRPNILLSILFSNTLSFSDQVSHPYKTTGKIIFLLIFFLFLEDSAPSDSQH